MGIKELYEENLKNPPSSPFKMLRRNKSSGEQIKQQYEFKLMKKVSEIKEGIGFGELALLGEQKKDKKRAATI